MRVCEAAEVTTDALSNSPTAVPFATAPPEEEKERLLSPALARERSRLKEVGKACIAWAAVAPCGPE
jgi:hypothetical protein